MGYFSNSSEGMAYEDKYCSKCVHNKAEGGCAVLFAHAMWGYGAEDDVKSILDVLIPRDDKGFNEECSMFVDDNDDARDNPELF